jgi:ABC-type spermidine/putrescine transport system permease subunit I
MILPMITFTAILLGLVQNNFVSDTLAFDTDDANYVRISATALITVASWSSTIAPILAGIAVTLVSYPLAKHLLTASEIHGTSQLPTPFQLSLIIRMISSGSFSAL